MSAWLSKYDDVKSQEILSEEESQEEKELLYSYKLEDYYNEDNYDNPISTDIIEDVIDDLIEPEPYLDIEEFLEDNIIPEPDSMSLYSISLTLSTTIPLFVLLIMMDVPMIINCLFTGSILLIMGWYTNRVFYETDFIKSASQYHNYSLIDYHLYLQCNDENSTHNDKEFVNTIIEEYENIKNNAIQYYHIISDNPSEKVVNEAREKLREELELFIQHYNDKLEAKKKTDSDVRELEQFNQDIQDDASIVNISMISDNHKARYS